MKPLHHTTAAQASPSVAPIGQWAMRLHSLHQRLAPYFARREPLHHALRYLKAIMSDTPRKNGWQIAEHARLERPYDEVGGQRGVALPSDLSEPF